MTSLWTGLLGLSLIVSVATSFLKTVEEPEYPNGCDGFGYLYLAKQFNEGFAQRALPDISLDTPQTRLLIEHLKKTSAPSTAWEEGAGPLSYHYSERVDRLITAYPPGTSLVLAPFEEGKAVRLLDRWTIVAIALLGVFLGWRAWRASNWAALGFVALAVHLTVRLMGSMGGRSYSMNALVAPLVFAVVLWLWGAGKNSLRAIGAGALMGLAFMIRIPALLLLPGLWSRKFTAKEFLWGIFGFALCGAIPLMLYHHWITGAWYVSTYGHKDAQGPTLSMLGHHLQHYLLGEGSRQNWALYVSVLGTLGLVYRGRLRTLSVVIGVWGLSLAFFLTHAIETNYYTIPATLMGIWVLALRSLDQEKVGIKALAYLPGLVMIVQSGVFLRNNQPLFFAPSLAIEKFRVQEADVPAELKDPSAWVWADMTTGTFWYAAKKASFKVAYFDPETRAGVYQFVKSRGEPQFFVQDYEGAPTLMRDFERLGAKLVARGQVFGVPYYKVEWTN